MTLSPLSLRSGSVLTKTQTRILNEIGKRYDLDKQLGQ